MIFRTKVLGGGGYNSQNQQDNCIKTQVSCKKRQRFNFKKRMLLSALIFFSFLFGFAMAISFSIAFLSDSKTATGTIAFEFDSPTLAFGDALELYCEGRVSSNANITFGNLSAEGTSLASLYSRKLSVEQNSSPFTEYYVKVVYDFSSIENATIGLGNASSAYGGITMCAPVQSTTNVLYTQSVVSASDSTQAKVPVGKDTFFDIYSIIKNMTFVGNVEFATSTPLEFVISVLADTSPNFNSKHRAQANLLGKLGVKVVDSPALTLGGLISDGFQIKFLECTKSEASFTNSSASGNSFISANEDIFLTIVLNLQYFAPNECAINNSIVATNGTQNQTVNVTHECTGTGTDILSPCTITFKLGKLNAGYYFDFIKLFGAVGERNYWQDNCSASISIYYSKTQGGELSTFVENITGTEYIDLNCYGPHKVVL